LRARTLDGIQRGRERMNPIHCARNVLSVCAAVSRQDERFERGRDRFPAVRRHCHNRSDVLRALSMPAPTNNLAYPKIVWARVPECASEYLRLTVSEKTLASLFGDRRYAALGEYAGLILQEGVLAAPTAIYQGLRRPLDRPGVSATVYAYVSRPQRSYTYRTPGVVTPDRLAVTAAPVDSVFIAFVLLNPLMVHEALVERPDDREVAGTVLFWEWTMASEAMPDLPRDDGDRYGRKVWPQQQ
jgi:hypothetical protein